MSHKRITASWHINHDLTPSEKQNMINNMARFKKSSPKLPLVVKYHPGPGQDIKTKTYGDKVQFAQEHDARTLKWRIEKLIADQYLKSRYLNILEHELYKRGGTFHVSTPEVHNGTWTTQLFVTPSSSSPPPSTRVPSHVPLHMHYTAPSPSASPRASSPSPRASPSPSPRAPPGPHLAAELAKIRAEQAQKRQRNNNENNRPSKRPSKRPRK